MAMKGEVVYLYAFDVANEIILSAARDIVSGSPMSLTLHSKRTLPKDVSLYKPYAVSLSSLDKRLQGREVYPTMHIYEVGVISIVMRVPFEVKHLHELLPMHTPMLGDGKALGQAAYDLCAKTCAQLGAALKQPTALHEPEAYTVFCLTDIGTDKKLETWMENNRRNIAELITENTSGILSEMQVQEVLRIHRSYANTDLAIIDWDAALIVDLAGYVEDTLYVLELANLQLEEYKVMDRRLDIYLDTAYEDIQSRRFHFFGTYSAILRRLRTLRVDVTKLHDEVTHITKFFGDWYLARVYMGARERFHLGQWRNSVEERLRQIDALYSVAHTEMTNQRMLWLELLVVILFVIDIAGLFLFKY